MPISSSPMAAFWPLGPDQKLLDQSRRLGARENRVVPFSMKRVAEDVDCLHFVIGNDNAGGVRAGVELGLYDQALGGAHAADEVDDRLVVDERPATPVLGDVAEEAVF